MKHNPQSPTPRSRGHYGGESPRTLVGGRGFAGQAREGPQAKRRRTTVTSQLEAGYESVEGVYIISVAARLLEMHPQTLRKYERAGLIRPSRTGGALRLYSEEDIARLRLIKHLVGDLGLNLAGVQVILQLFNHMLTMRAQLSSVGPRDLRSHVNESLDEMFELLHAHLS